MNYELDDLQKLTQARTSKDDAAAHERHAYLKGREGYPSAPPEYLNEKDRGLYMMGFNTTKWEQGHV